MRKHDGGMLSLRAGEQQRTCERDITVFESDFFPTDGNSHRERSGLFIESDPTDPNQLPELPRR